VAAQPHDVSRDEAARALGLRRNLAAFHLDRLVAAGLLDATYRRLTGRTGPGAGRPAKLYRRSAARHSLSLPPRRYEVAARVLAEAVADASPDVAAAACQAAERAGEAQGRARSELDPPLAAGSGVGAGHRLRRALAAAGYEPYVEGRQLLLGNCPFHELVEAHRDVVCAMNVAFLRGMARGLGDPEAAVRPDPGPGRCCVTMRSCYEHLS
jgi:predicted ArsR family transcriptional regulator